MKTLLSISILFISIAGSAQKFPKNYVDSLTNVALSRSTNTSVNSDRRMLLKELFQAESHKKQIALFYSIVAGYDELTPEQTLSYHKIILNRARNENNKVLEAVVLAELGYITCQNGNTAKGLKMIYEALDKAELTGNAQAIGIAYNNLGNSYPNNPKLSIEYYNKALRFSSKANDFPFVAYNLGNLGGVYLRENKRDSALIYFLKSYKTAVVHNTYQAIASGLLNLSRFDSTTNRSQYYKQIYKLPYAKQNADIKRRIDQNNALFYIEQKNRDSAYFFATRAFKSTKYADAKTKLSALNLMAKYYATFKNSDSALYYVNRSYQLKDSIYGDKVIATAQDMAYNDRQRLKELEDLKVVSNNRLKLYGLASVATFLLILAFLFWRSKNKEENAKLILQLQKDRLQEILTQLKATQTQLIQSEKMASLGELTAGIAHEIQNPLNFVNNFSEVSSELLEEMNLELDKGAIEEAKLIAADIKLNLEKINHHGKRADAIVKGMLQHSRSSTGLKEPTDLNALCDEYLRLSYHGLRAKDKTFNATIVTDFDKSIGKISIIRQDFGRVILNLLTNAFYAVNEKKHLNIDNYKPTVSVSTKRETNKIVITIADNGSGMEPEVIAKIFQPFFTTKPSGEGTGLGLSMSYDIITKGHNGQLTVKSKKNKGTEFRIILVKSVKR